MTDSPPLDPLVDLNRVKNPTLGYKTKGPLDWHGSSCGGLPDRLVRLRRDCVNDFGGKSRLAQDEERSRR